MDFRRARDANVWAYTRQTVVRFPDWYAADEGLRNERRLTDANPQQKDVAWTPGARLIDYECENGLGRQQAVLILPAPDARSSTRASGDGASSSKSGMSAEYSAMKPS